MVFQVDSERHKLFSRRIAMLAGGKVALLTLLAGRMYYLQVVEAERYKTLADENRISFRLLPPPRGRIVDRFGVPLADNKQNYRVMMISEKIRDRDVTYTLDMLSHIVPFTEAERKRILRDVRRNRSFVPITLRENLEWEDVARIEVNAPDLPGVVIDEGQSRFYPFGGDLAHILGYVSAVTEKEKEKEKARGEGRETAAGRLLELPGFRTGKSGVERIHDLALRGLGGNSQVEVNAYGRVLRELNRREGVAGSEVELTIDVGLQLATSKRLSEEGSAAAVVLDIHSGDVLAMASTPNYDPSAFNRGLSTKEWKGLVNNPLTPLINKAIAGHYAPGSTFKMLVALAALEKGVIGPHNKVFCPGHVQLGNARFHCWKKGGHGSVDLNRAISKSCDVYFYEIAKRTGIDRIADMAKRFGLGDVTGLDLPGERPGLMPTKAWKRKALDQRWHKGETLIAGIGQGYVLTTPLQLAVMTARLANGGIAVTPRLTRRIVRAGGEEEIPVNEVAPIGVAANHLNLMRDAMVAVTSPGGTAYRARIEDPETAMAGKTGTAQVRRITKAERDGGVIKNKDLPWEERDHALFVGYAPVKAPRYAVAVVVEHGGGGSKVAAPIARDILIEAQKRDSARGGLTVPVKAPAEAPLKGIDGEPETAPAQAPKAPGQQAHAKGPRDSG